MAALPVPPLLHLCLPGLRPAGIAAIHTHSAAPFTQPETLSSQHPISRPVVFLRWPCCKHVFRHAVPSIEQQPTHAAGFGSRDCTAEVQQPLLC